MARTSKVPFLPGQPTVCIDAVIGWWRTALKQNWKDMMEDADLKSKYGQGWFHHRSRLPQEWRSTLGLKLVGRKRHLEKYPGLVDVVREADKIHEQQRTGKRHCDQEGFRQTNISVLQMKNYELADEEMPQIVGPKMSRSWLQQQARDLEAKTQRVSSTEAK